MEKGPLFVFLPRLESGCVIHQRVFGISVYLRGPRKYIVTYVGCVLRYPVGSVTELLMVIGEERAFSPDWEFGAEFALGR